MICPRCGYPETKDPCCLCGLNGFVDYEIGRYDGRSGSRFEITVVFSQPPSPDQFWNFIQSQYSHQILPRRTPLHYVFFPNGSIDSLFDLINRVKHSDGWELLVNGRPRPYIEELWLPLLQLLASPGV